MKPTYTVKEVAEILGYSTNSIYTFLKGRKIKSVRIGKGKFAIPASEVTRLSSVRGTHAPTASVMTDGPVAVGEYVAVDATPVKTRIPDVFDWLVGVSAVCVGLAAVLFPRLGVFPGIAAVSSILRFGLSAAGIAYALDNAFRVRTRVGTMSVYGAVAAVLFAAEAAGLGMAGRMDTMVVCGLLAIGVVCRLAGMRGTNVLAGYGIAASVLIPIAAGMPGMAGGSFFALNPDVAAWLAWGVFVLLYALMLRWSALRLPSLFGVLAVVAAMGGAALAFAYAGFRQWDMVALFAAASSAVVLSSLYGNPQPFRAERLVTALCFLLLPVGLAGFLCTVRLIEDSMLATGRGYLSDKVTYGKALVSSDAEAVRSSVEGMAGNAAVIAQLQKRTPGDVSDVSRGVFEGNSVLASIHVLGVSGTELSSYPYGALPLPDAFHTSKTILHRKNGAELVAYGVVGTPMEYAYVSPVFSAAGERIGDIVGVVGMATLGDRLGEIALSPEGEITGIIDADGVFMASGATRGQGEVPEFARSSAGRRGMALFESKGLGVLASYAPVPDTGWTVVIVSPLSRLMRTELIRTVCAFVFAVWSVILVSVAVALRMRRGSARGRGSP